MIDDMVNGGYRKDMMAWGSLCFFFFFLELGGNEHAPTICVVLFMKCSF